MLRAIASLLVILVAACAPSERRPVDVPPWVSVAGGPGTYTLFDSCTAARPFAVGDTMEWRWLNGPRLDHWRVADIVSCDQSGGDSAVTSYSLARDDRVVGATYEFFPIESTPEEDYVVQTITPSEDYPDVSYAYIWRAADGWGATAAKTYDDLNERQRRFCIEPRVARPHPRYVFVCNFASSRQVIGYYREVVYPEWRNDSGTTP